MSADEEAMLTTIDNPYDPFTQYDDWFAWDLRSGYNTPGALARQVVSSDDLSEMDQRLAINSAIDIMVADNLTGVYKKVSRKL